MSCHRQAVFLCKRPESYVLNKALLYVRQNEATVGALRIVHCYQDEVGDRELFREFRRHVQLGG